MRTCRLFLSLFCWAALATATATVEAAAPKAVLRGPETLPAGGTLVLDARASVSDKPLEWRVRGPDLVLLSLDSGGRQGVIAMAMNVPGGADNKPVVYRFILVAKGKPDPSAELDVDVDILDVAVGGIGPAPTPTPIPPGPTPGPTPTPVPPTPTPAPIPAPGLHVLMIYETADLSKLPPAQQAVFFSRNVRDYLNTKCPPGADGKTKEWRIWDANVDASGESQVWQDALKRPRSSVPWLVISNPGKGGYEGPVPPTVDETLTLLKRYGGD